MTAEKDGESPVENGTQRNNDANLWAPDTLDHQSGTMSYYLPGPLHYLLPDFHFPD